MTIAQNHIPTEINQHKDNIERIPVVIGQISNLGGHISPSSSSGSSHLIYNGSNCIQSDVTQQVRFIINYFLSSRKMTYRALFIVF